MGTDGNGDRPSGRVAENWGRRDHIRAGSVSGPWRSAPRADEAAAAPPVAPHRREPPAPPASAGRPEPAAAPPLARADEAYDPPAPRSHPVRSAVLVGVIAALAIVAAAFLLRPDPNTAPAPQAAAPAGPAVAAVTPPTQAPVRDPVAPEAAGADPVAGAPDVAAAVAPGAIRLRVGPNLAEERRVAIATALEAAGYGPVQVEVLPFPITASRVGYYRPDDGAAAAALAAFVDGVLGEPGDAISTRDYSRLLEGTAPGRLDIWIEG